MGGGGGVGGGVGKSYLSKKKKFIFNYLCVFLHNAKQYFQVIGTLPLLVNPASLAAGAATPTLPLQGLQVQTVTPQLLLNTQGQIIATVANGAATVATSAAVLPKAAAAPPTLTKPNTQVDKHLALRSALIYTGFI